MYHVSNTSSQLQLTKTIDEISIWIKNSSVISKLFLFSLHITFSFHFFYLSLSIRMMIDNENEMQFTWGTAL
jgi:hypothetical protein